MKTDRVGIVEVGEKHGVTLQTVLNWCDRGCPYTEGYKGLKKVKLFDLSEVEEWVNMQRGN